MRSNWYIYKEDHGLFAGVDWENMSAPARWTNNPAGASGWMNKAVAIRVAYMLEGRQVFASVVSKAWVQKKYKDKA